MSPFLFILDQESAHSIVSNKVDARNLLEALRGDREKGSAEVLASAMCKQLGKLCPLTPPFGFNSLANTEVCSLYICVLVWFVFEGAYDCECLRVVPMLH